jgi:hypothetical protein
MKLIKFAIIFVIILSNLVLSKLELKNHMNALRSGQKPTSFSSGPGQNQKNSEKNESSKGDEAIQVLTSTFEQIIKEGKQTVNKKEDWSQNAQNEFACDVLNFCKIYGREKTIASVYYFHEHGTLDEIEKVKKDFSNIEYYSDKKNGWLYKFTKISWPALYSMITATIGNVNEDYDKLVKNQIADYNFSLTPEGKFKKLEKMLKEVDKSTKVGSASGSKDKTQNTSDSVGTVANVGNIDLSSVGVGSIFSIVGIAKDMLVNKQKDDILKILLKSDTSTLNEKGAKDFWKCSGSNNGEKLNCPKRKFK